MPRFFNNAGPNKPNLHYTIDPLTRVDWPEVHHLISQQRYFVLHAPRQTGKTSTLLSMMQTLNQEGQFACAYANIEGAQAARGDETQGIPTVCSAIASSIRLYLKDEQPLHWLQKEGPHYPPQDRLRQMLEFWASHSDKETVLFLDEVDALVGDTLISLLRQIRAGYAQRPEAFPQSIILCGVRDVRDYRLYSAEQEVITGGSAFNIKATSLRMGNFSQQDIQTLWQQHTDETGQAFAAEILPELWADTQGQPWLVNALAHGLTWENRAARDRSQNITLEDYFAVRERLIYSRQTHLDQLVDKLKEPRVHRVISTLLSDTEDQNIPLAKIQSDDIQYTEDLGLITSHPNLKISNRIYQEVIPRELTWVAQVSLANQEQQWYLTQDNRLDLNKLLSAFQQFYRENSDIWLEKFDYKEAAPQLLLQAFLQRIINGGGRINREYGLGRKRTDLLIEWPLDPQLKFTGPVQKIVIELKILHQNLDKTIEKGCQQTTDYRSHMGADEAHLMIFNRNPKVLWQDKIWQKEHTIDQQIISVWGL